MLPSAQMVRRPDRLNCAFVWNSSVAEAHRVDAYAIELVNGLSCRGIAVRNQSSRDSKHSSVEVKFDFTGASKLSCASAGGIHSSGTGLASGFAARPGGGPDGAAYS